MRLRDATPDAMAQAVDIHGQVVSEAAARGGVELALASAGTGAAAGFRSPADALHAALDVRRAARAREWPEELGARMRTALHTAELKPGLERNHAALALGRCARLAAVARGGQTLMSRATRELVLAQLPDGAELVDLGFHRLPDLGQPEHVYGLADGDEPEAPRSLDALPNNLPYGLTSFVGRARELAEVAGVLGGVRLLTLTGAGGCGKTRLALQVAADALARFPDGAWRVELAPVSDPAMVGQAVADAVGARSLPGRSGLDAAVAHLRARRALILLDNCEHVADGVAEVAEALLSGCPDAVVLATSRAPLGLPAETAWRVPSLSLPEHGTGEPLDSLADADAVRLFVERATKVRPDFRVGEATAPVLAEVCSDLDGIPLAIELAAARVRLMPIEQVAAGLSDRFRLLTGGTRASLPRHRTLRASVDWSHALLSDEERTLLRRLGVFVGGFTLEAAEQVCALDDSERAAIIDVLAALVDKSLVTVEERGGAARYRLLETVREYELELLREAEELDSVHDRHCGFFLALAERAGPAQELDVLDKDRENLDAALRWATETDGERALRMCAALMSWWIQRGPYVARDASCARALGKAGREPTALRAQVLSGRARLLTAAGTYEAAKAVAQEALELAEEVGEPAQIGAAVGAIGPIALAASDPSSVRPLQRRVRALLRASGEDLLLVATTQTMGWGHMLCGEYEEGEALLQEVFPMAERMGNLERLSWHWMGMAFVHQHDGQTERFFELIGRSIDAAQESGNPLMASVADATAAGVELALGRTERALARLERSREVGVAAGANLALATAEYMLASAEATLGDLEGARARLEALAPKLVDSFNFGWAAAQFADVLRVSGDAAAAEDWAHRGLEVNERIGTPHGISWCKEILGRLAADRGDWGKAEALFHEALAARAERRHRLWLPQSLDGLALVAAGLAAHEEAARLFGAAERARSDVGSVRWAPDRPRFEALEGELRRAMGDEAFAAALAEGSQLTLEEAVAWIRRARGSRKRPPGGWESLTPTELEVTRHAAAGLTNAEIGQAMFISPGTVKTHLSHIYAKLGVRNRTQLTALAAGRRSAGPAA